VRALVVAIVVALGASGGVLAARVAPVGEGAAAASTPVDAAPAAAADERVEATALADVGLTLVDGLTAGLPVPEPSPLDARAPTPEVRYGMLEIPSIGLSQPFFEGVTLTAIDRGPSHWPGTAMPGELGNVVIAGHRTTRSRPFWDLDLVQPGDELIFTMDTGERYVYALDLVEVVDDEALHIVDQGYGYTATLFGCHPKGSARQRIVGHFSLRSATPAPVAASPTP
jgi:LPXTG-site transpeptidase (sortase) family protein